MGLIQKCNFLYDGGCVDGVSVYVGGAWGRLKEAALATLTGCMEEDEDIIMYGGTD